MDQQHIAQIVHATMVAFAKSIGQPGMPAWDDAPDWMQKATLEGVAYRLANPDAPDSAQHTQWMEEKRAAGWTYGAEKDESKKTHPMMIPYDQLPEEEKRKDALFSTVVRTLAE